MSTLKKRICKNGMEYMLVGEVYVPMLVIAENTKKLGRWGRMRLNYIKTEKPWIYQEMMLNNTLWEYLAEVENQAQAENDLLMAQMKCREGITEELKRQNPLEWVGKMENLQIRIKEIIKSQLIYK